MKKLAIILLGFGLVGLTSCSNTSHETFPEAMGFNQSPEQNNPVSQNNNHSKMNNNFQVVRIMDINGFGRDVEAATIMSPRGWQTEYDLIWNRPGTQCEGNNFRLKMTSPDGQTSIEIFPNSIWSDVSQEMLAMGAGARNPNLNCFNGPGMNASQYAQNYFIREINDNPRMSNIQPNTEIQAELKQKADASVSKLIHNGNTRVENEATAINADLNFGNGREGFMMCGTVISRMYMQNQYTGGMQTITISMAGKKAAVTCPAGKLSHAKEILFAVLDSYQENPSWKESADKFWTEARQQSKMNSDRTIAAIDARTNQIMNEMRQYAITSQQRMDQQMADWRSKQASIDNNHAAYMDNLRGSSPTSSGYDSDKSHRQFVNTMREVDQYSDQTGTYEVSNQTQSMWSKNDGSSFISSDNPYFEPSDPNWTRMNKVE